MKRILAYLGIVLFFVSCSTYVSQDVSKVKTPEIPEMSSIGFDTKADELRQANNLEELILLSKEYCQKDLPQACYTLGTMQAKGEATTKDLRLAKENFKSACNENYAKACNSLGLIYKINGDMKNAQKYFQKSAMLGCELGNYSLGLLYEGANQMLALENFQKGCDLNHAKSCIKLAQILRTNNENKNEEQEISDIVLSYDTKACELKDPQGCFNAGISNYKNKKYEDAILNFKSGCELGNYPSCERALDLIKKDQILTKDQKEELLKSLDETILKNKMGDGNEKI